MAVHDIAGHLRGDQCRVGLVVSRTNAVVTERLLDGALDMLRRSSCREEDIVVVRVPGALELSQVAWRLVDTGKVDAVICIGTVLRGQTPHFMYVSSAAIHGIARVALHAAHRGIVVTTAVLTCDTLDQAVERAGAKAGNKGAEAAMAAMELYDLGRQFFKTTTDRHASRRRSRLSPKSSRHPSKNDARRTTLFS